MPDNLTKRWIRSEADERAVRSGCRFNERFGEHVVQFFRDYLRHSKGSKWAGKPFTLLEWQYRDLIMPLFGWVTAEGLRRYNRAGIWIPKKNGKSTLAAGIGLYLLVGDGEPGAEVYSCGVDSDQAAIVHSQAIDMVESSPELSSVLKINRTTKRITHHATKSYYAAVAAEAGGFEGKNAHGVIIDELHVWSKKREMFNAARYSGAGRTQPLLLAISTAGIYNRETVGWEQYDYAKRVLDGSVEDQSFFGYVAEASQEQIEGDGWTEPAVWAAANPSWDVTIRPQEMAESCEVAKAIPTERLSFLRYRLNVWTAQESTWISDGQWMANAGPLTHAEMESDLQGRECWAALDVSSVRDLTALSLIFPDSEGGYDLLSYCWVPLDTAHDRDGAGLTQYLTWIEDGCLRGIRGNRIEQKEILQFLVGELSERYRIREVVCDRWQAEFMISELSGTGLDVYKFGQGYASMSTPMKQLESLALAGQLRHGGHPVLRWCIGNIVADVDAAGNVKPNKAKSADKIDLAVTTIMALGGAMVAEPAERNVYAERGLVIIGDDEDADYGDAWED